MQRRQKNGSAVVKERSGLVSKILMAAIELLLLTGCRLSEVLNLRWSDIDFERRFLLLPNNKTGAKAVYLSEAALRIIRDIQSRDESPYFSPGKRASQPLHSIRVPWEHICKAARLNNLRLHDLRHSFASVGAANGLSLPMIGALLGQSSPAQPRAMPTSPLRHSTKRSTRLARGSTARCSLRSERWMCEFAETR
jgi:integrase